MVALISALYSWLTCRFGSRVELELELIALHHQIAILNRQRPGRPWFRAVDRLLWVWLYRVWPRCLEVMVLVKPATVVQWHRQGFRLYWRWRSRSGRKPVDRETRKLIREMCLANALWGAPRIHGELLKLGIKVSQATVAKYMVRRPHPSSPTWRSFLRNQALGIAAIDMFIVPSATFRLLFVMLILAHDRRKIVRFDVTQHPTAGWLSRQVTEAFPWDTAPRFLLRDRDASYGTAFRTTGRSDGHHRSPHCSALTVAERLCREGHRLYPAGVSGSPHHLQRAPFAARPFLLRGLLPPNPDASIAQKRLPGSRVQSSRRRGKVIAIPQVGGLHHRYERLAA